jgi:iron complex outermembrane receptor protein
MKKTAGLTLLLSVSCTCILGATPVRAFAAATDASAETSSDTGLSEILVTSRRVSEDLQTVPISVSAFTPDQIAAQGIVNITDVAMTTPNLHMAPAIGTSNTASISLRGQYQQENLLTVDPSVGLYIDDVYYARDYSILSDLLDVSGVEVLKGPQGILYGRNTTGGAIKVTTAAADPNGAYSGFADATYGNYDAVSFSGALNMPIIPGTLALRYTGSYRWHQGYTDSWLVPVNPADGIATSLTPYADIHTDNENRYTQRLSARFTPNDKLTIDLVGSVFHANENAALNVNIYGDVQNYVFGNATPSVFSNSPQRNASFYSALTDWPSSSLNDTKSGSSTIQWVVSDALTAKVILGWVQGSNLSYTNSDGTVSPGLAFINIGVRENQDQRQTSEELQLIGNGMDKRINWQAGVYNFEESGHEDELGRLFIFDANATTTGAYDARNKSKAVYGNLIFSVTDDWRVNGGLRYTEDDKAIDSYPRTYPAPEVCILSAVDGFGNPIPGVTTSTTPNGPCSFVNTLKNHYPLFEVGTDYKFGRDTFVYAKVNDAERSGGQQGRVPVGVFPTPFQPEKLTNFEAGVKSELFDRHLRLNLSVFHDLYKDIQETVVVVEPSHATASLEGNFGDAIINGLEFEGVARMGQFTLNSGVGYTRILFSEPVTGQPDSPEFTFELSPEFTQPTALGDFNVRIDYNYTSWVYYVVQTSTPNPTLPGYGLVNGRAGLKLNNGLELSLFGKNLTNKQYYNQAYDAGYTPNLFWGVRQAYVGAPRTYGIEARYKF